MGSGPSRQKPSVEVRPPRQQPDNNEEIERKEQAIVERLTGRPCPGYNQITETLRPNEIREALRANECDLRLDDDNLDNVATVVCRNRQIIAIFHGYYHENVTGRPCPRCDEITETLGETEIKRALKSHSNICDLRLEGDNIKNVTKKDERLSTLKKESDALNEEKTRRVRVAMIKAEAGQERGLPTDRTVLPADSTDGS